MSNCRFRSRKAGKADSSKPTLRTHTNLLESRLLQGSPPTGVNQANAPIAQLVEQMTLNHWVQGSSPCGGTLGSSPIPIEELNPDIVGVFLYLD